MVLWYRHLKRQNSNITINKALQDLSQQNFKQYLHIAQSIAKFIQFWIFFYILYEDL